MSDLKSADQTPTRSTQVGTREPGNAEAVPSWLFLEVPITHMELKSLDSIKTDERPGYIMRRLMLRFIYGGPEIRRAMLGEAQP